ncbi:hypothetical protein F5877DRAFT_67202 [Lentinula edodes]|nr:hypothetical protein F5877DRAFT_67202 [Lentinula edodes]
MTPWPFLPSSIFLVLSSRSFLDVAMCCKNLSSIIRLPRGRVVFGISEKQEQEDGPEIQGEEPTFEVDNLLNPRHDYLPYPTRIQPPMRQLVKRSTYTQGNIQLPTPVPCTTGIGHFCLWNNERSPGKEGGYIFLKEKSRLVAGGGEEAEGVAEVEEYLNAQQRLFQSFHTIHTWVESRYQIESTESLLDLGFPKF